MVKIGKYHINALKISVYFFLIVSVILILLNLILYQIFDEKSAHLKSHFLEHIIFSLFVSGVIYILLSKDYFVRNKFQAIIREEELKYQILFKNANDAILLIKDHYIIDCNLKSCEIFNCEKEYLVGKSLLNFSSESKNAERLLEYIKLSSSKPQHFEWKYSRNEEKSFDAEVTLNQVDMSGTLFIQVFIKDVTELRKSQRAFTDSEGKFKSIFNSVNDGIIIFTNNHRVLEVNDVVLRRYHLTKEEFIQLPPDNKFSKAIVSSINHYLPELELHDEILFEVEEVVTPEKTLLLEMRLRKLNYGGEAAYIVVGRDISQRKYNQMSQYNAVIQAEEQERSRVAKELHDGISPVLSTAKLYVQSIKDCKSDELKERVMGKIESTIEDSIVGISEISNKLSPHILQNFGVTAAVQSFIDKRKDLKGPRIEIISNWNGRLNENLEVTLYRVIIELINNSLKYAEATKVTVTLSKEENVKLFYSDNGKGFDVNEALSQKKGMGLFNIINRVKSLNGIIDYISKPGEGFNVSVQFKL